jgi:hypothetical protein
MATSYFTWAWHKEEDNSIMTESFQRFAREELCRNDGERNIPPYNLLSDEGLLNIGPTLCVTCHDIALVELGGNVRIQPCVYKGEPRVDIRLWSEVGGVLRRTRKGLSLTQDQWVNLLSARSVVRQQLDAIGGKERDVDIKYPLGGGYHVSLKSPYMMVDLRSWWRPEGSEYQPTTRGVRLRLIQWHALLRAELPVSQALTALLSVISN